MEDGGWKARRDCTGAVFLEIESREDKKGRFTVFLSSILHPPSAPSLLEDRQIIVGHLQDDAGHGGGVVIANLVDPAAVRRWRVRLISSSRMAGNHSVQ